MMLRHRQCIFRTSFPKRPSLSRRVKVLCLEQRNEILVPELGLGTVGGYMVFVVNLVLSIRRLAIGNRRFLRLVNQCLKTSVPAQVLPRRRVSIIGGWRFPWTQRDRADGRRSLKASSPAEPRGHPTRLPSAGWLQ